MNADLLTVPEAMERLKISRWTLYNLIRSGELRSVIVGERCRRIPLDALHDYLNDRMREAA